MKRAATFLNGSFLGYYDVEEIVDLENKAHKQAAEKQKQEQADHMIYAYRQYTDMDELDKAHIYTGYPLTDKEFEERTQNPHTLVKAIHKKS